MKQDCLSLLKDKCPSLALNPLNKEKPLRPLCDFFLPQSETQVLYVRGVGHLHWQKRIAKWLSGAEDRFVHCIVDAFDNLDALDCDLLQHERFKIGERQEIPIWEHLYQPWEWMGGTLEEKNAFAEKILAQEVRLALYRDFGIVHLRNAMKNLKDERTVINGRALRGAFRNVPAIICGAGASLEKSLDSLKEMGDKALIFGGGSALGPLSKSRIPVHFLVACDPDPPLERFFRQTYFEAPLFYQNQVASALLKSHQGPKICMGESGSFALEKWLEEDFNAEPFDAGWTVGTFATSIALFLGCTPIYLVGIDLSVSENGPYAKGVEGIDRKAHPLPACNGLGNKVCTRLDFLLSKKWLEDLAKRAPHSPFMHVSEEGLVLEGIPTGSLSSLLIHSIDLFGKVHQAFMQAPLLPLKTIHSKMKKLETSVQVIQRLLRRWIEKIEEENSRLLCECALEEELFYQLHLLPMWRVWKPLLQRETVVSAMERPLLEKKLQEILFYQQITEKWIDERHICP